MADSSAALFKAVSNSVTFFCIPNFINLSFMACASAGQGINKSGFFKKPSAFEAAPDELFVPTLNASFKPLITSSFVKLGAAFEGVKILDAISIAVVATVFVFTTSLAISFVTFNTLFNICA